MKKVVCFFDKLRLIPVPGDLVDLDDLVGLVLDCVVIVTVGLLVIGVGLTGVGGCVVTGAFPQMLGSSSSSPF